MRMRLRKIAATMCAENGGTELMAISDWATPAMATTCTRAANRGRLAADVLNLLDFESVSPRKH